MNKDSDFDSMIPVYGIGEGCDALAFITPSGLDTKVFLEEDGKRKQLNWIQSAHISSKPNKGLVFTINVFPGEESMIDRLSLNFDRECLIKLKFILQSFNSKKETIELFLTTEQWVDYATGCSVDDVILIETIMFTIDTLVPWHVIKEEIAE